jgi:hypothetical protein
LHIDFEIPVGTPLLVLPLSLYEIVVQGTLPSIVLLHRIVTTASYELVSLVVLVLGLVIVPVGVVEQVGGF